MSILADRYASSAMKQIWSAHSKILAERNLWIAVMKAQSQLGFDIPAPAIADYEKAKEYFMMAYNKLVSEIPGFVIKSSDILNNAINIYQYNQPLLQDCLEKKSKYS